MASFFLLIVFTQTLLVFVMGVVYKEWETRMMIAGNITEDVFPILPEKVLKIRYGGKNINPGDVIKLQRMSSPPTVIWDCNESLSMYFGAPVHYTLIMVDPDAPGLKRGRQKLVWLVDKIPGCEVNKGVELAKYQQPNPPDGTGLHRYITCQFIRGPCFFWYFWNCGGYNQRIDRENFSMTVFARDGRYGVPHACSFFKA